MPRPLVIGLKVCVRPKACLCSAHRPRAPSAGSTELAPPGSSIMFLSLGNHLPLCHPTWHSRSGPDDDCSPSLAPSLPFTPLFREERGKNCWEVGEGGGAETERVADRNMKLTKIRRSSLVETDGPNLNSLDLK